jgi:hypothetical protein
LSFLLLVWLIAIITPRGYIAYKTLYQVDQSRNIHQGTLSSPPFRSALNSVSKWGDDRYASSRLPLPWRAYHLAILSSWSLNPQRCYRACFAPYSVSVALSSLSGLLGINSLIPTVMGVDRAESSHIELSWAYARTERKSKSLE